MHMSTVAEELVVCDVVWSGAVNVLFLLSALIFDGSANPAHPKHIGSIDPNCDVVEVIKGTQIGRAHV